MARKINFTSPSGNDYYRINAVIGKNADGTYIRKQFYGSSKKEAETKKREYLEKIHGGLNADFADMTVGNLMKRWLFNFVRFDRSYATFDRYESVYRNYVANGSIAPLKVHEIKPLLLKGHYNKMAEEGHSPSKIFNLNKLLRTFFSFAVAEGYILKNPCSGVTVPKEHPDGFATTRIDPFNDEEIAAIMDAAKGSMKALFQFSLATGLRRGETLGLMVKDVNLGEMTVDVRQALKKVKQFISEDEYEYVTILEKPKTPGSVRVVPLPSGMKNILEQHIRSEEEKHRRLGLPRTEESLLFTSDACTPYDGKNVGIAFKRLLKRAGIRYRCFHNIRHTYATKLFEARVPLLTISRLLGHSNINITAGTYVSVMPKEKSEAAESLNYLFGQD